MNARRGMLVGVTSILLPFLVYFLWFLETPHIYYGSPDSTHRQLPVFPVRAVGSATLNNLMVLWSEKIRFIPVDYQIQVVMEPKGSSAAATALLTGTADLGPMSRPMDQTEIKWFEQKWGFQPLEITVAWDVIRVFVHYQNPLSMLSVSQVRSIFGSLAQQPKGAAITRWGHLFSDHWLSPQTIRLNAPSSSSGTYLFFKHHIMKNLDLRISLREYSSGAAILQSIADDPASIGFASAGFRIPHVRAVKVLFDECYRKLPDSLRQTGSQEDIHLFCPPHQAEVVLKRPLSIYLIPQRSLAFEKGIQPFLEFVLSEKGQKFVDRDGYHPLDPHERELQRKKLLSILSLNPYE